MNSRLAHGAMSQRSSFLQRFHNHALNPAAELIQIMSAGGSLAAHFPR
jgi:hypothetical protein